MEQRYLQLKLKASRRDQAEAVFSTPVEDHSMAAAEQRGYSSRQYFHIRVDDQRVAAMLFLDLLVVDLLALTPELAVRVLTVWQLCRVSHAPRDERKAIVFPDRKEWPCGRWSDSSEGTELDQKAVDAILQTAAADGDVQATIRLWWPAHLRGTPWVSPERARIMDEGQPIWLWYDVQPLKAHVKVGNGCTYIWVTEGERGRPDTSRPNELAERGALIMPRLSDEMPMSPPVVPGP